MKRAIALAVLWVGCASTETKPVQTTSSALAPAPTTQSSSLAELTTIVPKSTLQAGPFAWPENGTSAVVRGENDSWVAWKSSDATGSIRLPRDAARAVLRDVTKDGKPELVVFANPKGDESSTWIVGMAPTKKPARMWRLEAQVLGATDEASLDAELAKPTLGAATSPVKLIARLPLATPDELKALVGAQGLKLCNRQGMKKTCSTIAQQSIDRRQLTTIVERGGTIATFEPLNGEFGLQVPGCTQLSCVSSVGGPQGGQWLFEKTTTGLRLAEVWSWAEDS